MTRPSSQSQSAKACSVADASNVSASSVIESNQAINYLLDIMRQLRDPISGCPWDIAQTMQSLAPYAIEEAYELEEAISQQPVNINQVINELGDLLLQVVFQSQVASENNQFNFDDVVNSIVEKMIRRHPHVFADEPSPTITSDGVKANWEQIKSAERRKKGQSGLLDDVSVTLPGLLRAVKLQKRAASVGFDWDSPIKVIDKIREELDELEVEIKAQHQENSVDELGDVLFGLANLARHLKINPETAIKRTNKKFIQRFTYIETRKPANLTLSELSLHEMENLWNAAKQQNRQ